MKTRRTLALVAASALASPAVAQSDRAWPSRPLRIVVPYAAGGSTDIAARILAERMAVDLGRSVLVDNRAGAGGLIGAEHVAKSAPDGYTILMGTTGLFCIAPHLQTMPFQPLQDFTPVSLVFSTDLVVTVAKNVSAQTMQEFVALAKAAPDTISYASSGNGTTTHVASELLALTAGIDMQHVPYRGSGPAMNDLVAGNVQVMVDQIASSVGQINDGRIRALAVTGTRRHPLLSQVPTVAEVGLAGAQASSWGGLVVPAGTDGPIISRLNTSVRNALSDPTVTRRMSEAGTDPLGTTPAEFTTFIQEENTKWARVIRDAQIKIG
jgi:tripartite-type tricarboxylate transporter receptor subunit TctC